MQQQLLQEEVQNNAALPLASRMRPRSLAEFVGQQHILAPGRPLQKALESGVSHSMILWGPPGVGKTTLARLLAARIGSNFISLSAVLSGIKDIRDAVDVCKRGRALHQQQFVVFVDEVHRFNKTQQDAFLPHIEDGTLIFIGATTENPGFELNSALLSRARTYVLKSLDQESIRAVIKHALIDGERGLGALNLHIEPDAMAGLVGLADGDARRALNLLELASDLTSPGADGVAVINATHVGLVAQETLRRFDKGGDLFYEQISALHKAVRGSSPDGALYWLVRMLDGGCDPLYIARRLIRIASEDVGNADPRALQLVLDGWDAFVRLGSPEGELAIAQTVIYLACAAKSNAVYTAYNAARQAVAESGSLEVPLHLRNASTSLSHQLGYGSEYRYAHDEPQAYAAGENYLPEKLHDRRFYDPRDSGLEARIREKLDHLANLDRHSKQQRHPAEKAIGEQGDKES